MINDVQHFRFLFEKILWLWKEPFYSPLWLSRSVAALEGWCCILGQYKKIADIVPLACGFNSSKRDKQRLILVSSSAVFVDVRFLGPV